MTSDARLSTAALRAGDHDACAALVAAHGGRMLLLARRLLRREEEAQEAVKDAFLAAFLALDRFDGAIGMATWLDRSVVRACLHALRERKRPEPLAIDSLLPRFLPDGHQESGCRTWRDASEAGFDDPRLRDLVFDLVLRLPPAHAETLLLRDTCGLDVAETAAILGIEAAAVKRLQREARQALRALLDAHLAA